MSKAILAFLVIALFLAVTPLVLATDVVSIDWVEVDGMKVSEGANDLAVEVGNVLPIRVELTANMDATDAEISVWFRHYRSEGVGKKLPDLINGSKYNAKLSLEAPKNLDETEDTLTLVIEIETDEGSVRKEYTFNIQREPYKANILFVEVDDKVEAGSKVPVEIVIKNLGRHELDDLVVSVSIPELGIGKRAYFGDLTPTDDEDVYGEDAEDAVERRIYLSIPSTVKAGTYDLIVEAYNEDTESGVKKAITITGAEGASKVLVPVASKELGTGEVKTYSLVIVNTGSNIGIYEIVPETAEGVLVTVSEPLVTVPAGSSKVVEISVKAGSRDGTYSFAVNVNSEGKLVGRAVMNANVVKGAGAAITGKGNLTVLTVILAIVFVVLLIVLIVLLTRKPEKPEEFEESYY